VTSKRNHKQTLRSELTGQGLNIPDSQIYAGRPNEGMENNAIFMVADPSLSPGDSFGAGGEAIQRPSISVRVRHEEQDKGKSDADDVWQLLHDMNPADYSPPTMEQSGPIDGSRDDDGRFVWSVNVELFICE